MSYSTFGKRPLNTSAFTIVEIILFAVFATSIIVSVIVSQEQIWTTWIFSIALGVLLIYKARNRFYRLGNNMIEYPGRWTISLLSVITATTVTLATMGMVSPLLPVLFFLTAIFTAIGFNWSDIMRKYLIANWMMTALTAYLFTEWILRDLHPALFLVSGHFLLGMIVYRYWDDLKDDAFLWLSGYFALAAIVCYILYVIYDFEWMIAAIVGGLALLAILIHLGLLLSNYLEQRRIYRANQRAANELNPEGAAAPNLPRAKKWRLISALVVFLSTFVVWPIIWQVGVALPLVGIFIAWFKTSTWKEVGMWALAGIYMFVLFLAYIFNFYGQL